MSEGAAVVSRIRGEFRLNPYQGPSGSYNSPMISDGYRADLGACTGARQFMINAYVVTAITSIPLT
jgi:hypothetical protein